MASLSEFYQILKKLASILHRFFQNIQEEGYCRTMQTQKSTTEYFIKLNAETYEKSYTK